MDSSCNVIEIHYLCVWEMDQPAKNINLLQYEDNNYSNKPRYYLRGQFKKKKRLNTQ